tara:strand:+ start:792 stop:929 length:138 start_codon:yes stop_codon:yes gene_type:complete
MEFIIGLLVIVGMHLPGYAFYVNGKKTEAIAVTVIAYIIVLIKIF